MFWCDACEHVLRDDDVQFVNPGTSEDSEGIGYCTYCESEVEEWPIDDWREE